MPPQRHVGDRASPSEDILGRSLLKVSDLGVTLVISNLACGPLVRSNSAAPVSVPPPGC